MVPSARGVGVNDVDDVDGVGVGVDGGDGVGGDGC